MSQAKVDHYKEQKKNRKQIMKREKRMRILGRCAAGVVCVAIAAWIGWSAYRIYDSNRPASRTEVNVDSITDYYASLGEN